MKEKAVLSTSSSDDDEESEEEETCSDSDSSSDTSQAPPSKKPRKTPDARSNDSKKKATVAAADEEEEDTNMQQPFQRVFTEEDEIALLKGLFQYLKENQADDNHSGNINMVGFHAYIKDSIHTEITKAQLSDKIKRLKKRFKNNEGRVFKKDSHDKHVFKLCSKIWGVNEPAGKPVPDPAINPLSLSLRKPRLSLFDTGFEHHHAMHDNFGSCMDSVIDGCESGSVLKEKLIKLRVAHYELMIRENSLRNEQMQLIIECTKSKAK